MKKLQTSSPLPTGSSNVSEISTADQQPSKIEFATERARLLFGQYRRGDANDPDTYVASVAAILADYPTETVRYVTDPRTGIAANPVNPDWGGLPDIADVKRACEKHCDLLRRSAEREATIRRQFAERKALPEPSERSARPTYEELVRACNEVGIIIGPQKLQYPAMNSAEIMAKYGVSLEVWAATPDQAQRLGPSHLPDAGACESDGHNIKYCS